MHEILFRGKRMDNGEWVYGFPFSYKVGFAIEGIETWSGGRHRIDPSTVGQYTGLTDKHGKKIFEGDVVECLQEINGNWIDKHIEIGYVEMRYGAFGLHRKQGYYRPFKDWLEDYEYEVVGNIHDSPELLEEVSDNG